MKFIFTMLIFCVALSAQRFPEDGFPQVRDLDSVVVRYSTSCFAIPCRSYTVEVRGSGEVFYRGLGPVAVREQTARVDRTFVELLLAELRRVNFFWLLEFPPPDREGGREKRVMFPAVSLKGVIGPLEELVTPWVRGESR